MIETNTVLRELCEILHLDAKGAHTLFQSVGFEIPLSRVEGYLSEPDSKTFLDCGYEALGNFLDAVILYKRGEIKKLTQELQPLTNNLILKKIRIAFDLKEADLYAIFDAVDLEITKSELSSLFRKEDHKKFRSCPDSILLLFLEGLKICESQIE